MSGRDLPPSGAIAVVGLACRFPGADSPERFWANLRAGRDSIHRFSVEELRAAGVDAATLSDPRYIRAKGVLEDADSFDAGFFGISPREAALMDPQQRVFLECATAALDDAGIDPMLHPGAIGVFAGSILSLYLLQHLWPNRALIEAAGSFQTALGNDPTFLATRASYLLDLKGPSVSLGTACSTALVAVHLACQSLIARDSDVALAGGVSIHLPLASGYRFEDGGILSPDGVCRPFDAAARGTVSSDGAGIVVLKRLEDAIEERDTIRAVIRGSAVNNDGHAKVGYTAPSVAAQARVIAEALAVSGVAPGSIAMVEAHAAGTLLGDPIEVAALKQAFGTAGARPGSCALGSVKSNIGHVDAAAGIAGLIKTVLALQHGEIPPTLHYRTANPALALEDSPFYVNDRLRPLPAGPVPARAAVSAFGIGGTNAHVVLEQAPRVSPTPAPMRPYELLMLSARSPAALAEAAARLADHLEAQPALALADVAHTLRLGRRSFEHRRLIVCRDSPEAVAALRAEQRIEPPGPTKTPAVTFMFAGVGDHAPGLGWPLYCIEPAFRSTVDACAAGLRKVLPHDIRDHLFAGRNWHDPVLEPEHPGAEPGSGRLDLRAMLGRRDAAATPDAAPTLAQPAAFVLEIAMARLLQSWGLVAEAVLGYSIGEIAAATVAGIFTLPDACALVGARAALIETRVAPGAMLAVPLGEVDLRPLLPPGIAIAAVNGHASTVASGESAGIAALEKRLAATGTSCRRIAGSHAYHSAMMAAIVEPLRQRLAGLALRPPAIPLLSCVTGRWLGAAEATDPGYWAHHLCRTVRLHDALTVLLAEDNRLLLEIGPGQSLSAHAITERNRDPAQRQPVIPTMRWSYSRQSDHAVLLRAIGELWRAGVAFDRTCLLAAEGRRRVPLPTTPFTRQRHWIDPPGAAPAAAVSAAATPDAAKSPVIADWFTLPYWQPACRPPAQPCTAGEVLVLADPGGIGADLGAELTRRGLGVTTVMAGPEFRGADRHFTLDPSEPAHYGRLIEALRAADRLPDRILHLWSLPEVAPGAPSRGRFAALQPAGFCSLMGLLQAVMRARPEAAVRMDVVASQIFDPEGAAALCPEKTTLLGPLLVAPQEYPNLVCRCLDVALPPDDPARRRAIVAEILAEFDGVPQQPMVALRQGRRFVRGYAPVSLPAPSPERSPFRPRGVTVLTGGLGGVGRVLARHLADTAAARLVLVGRSAKLPPRAAWADWLARHGLEDPQSRRILAVQDLEARGAEVLVLQADVADQAAMAAALAAAEAQFGPVHGVIHAAGAIGRDTFAEIATTDTAAAAAQFRAKVQGLMVLDVLLGDRPLDFRLAMSSLSAVLGGLGFAAYSAANLFMDAFARRNNAVGRPPWTSVDWESWRLDDRQAVVAGLGASLDALAMTPSEGFEACRRILAESHLGHVVVSSAPLEGRLARWVEPRAAAAAASRPAAAFPRPALDTAYAAPRDQLETDLAAIWCELFQIEPIGIDDNFFALGGHSLLATQLNARLAARLGIDMSLATLLQAPTIAELALAITAAEAEAADPDLLAGMLAEIGTLPEAEVQRLLGDQRPERIPARDDV